MALDDLPGVAEVAMQSGAHAAHVIGRRVKGGYNTVHAFRYYDLGTLAVISRFRAVAKIGPIKVGGFPGMDAVAGGPCHVSHRIQESSRRSGPLGGELHRPGTL
jgi:hypothetical protein